MTRRAKFDNMEFDLGEVCEKRVKQLHKQNERIIKLKEKAKVDWKAAEYAKMYEDMEKHRDLRVPKLKFPKLHWPTYEEH